MNVLQKYETWGWNRLSRHVMYWFLWTFFFVGLNTITQSNHTFWQWAAFELTVLPIKIASTYFIAYGLLPYFLYRKKYFYFFASLFLAVFFFGSLLYMVCAFFVVPTILGEVELYTVDKFVYKGLELLYIASLVLGIKFFQNYLNEQQQNQKLAQQKIEAELKYLKNQIQPHFLFNTLNNIYGMILSNDPKAANYMVQLSEILSYMLYECNVEEMPLLKEVEILENFIALERLRYHRKLVFKYNKNISSPSLKIAPLLLIPIVENAFKHGPAKEEGESSIFVQLETQGNILYFSVENTYNKKRDLQNIQSGIGLENIKKRLKFQYPDLHTLKIDQSKTFKVSLIIELGNA